MVLAENSCIKIILNDSFAIQQQKSNEKYYKSEILVSLSIAATK